MLGHNVTHLDFTGREDFIPTLMELYPKVLTILTIYDRLIAKVFISKLSRFDNYSEQGLHMGVLRPWSKHERK